MSAVTERQYGEMSWHARQRLNDRLRRETRELRAEVADLQRRVREIVRGMPALAKDAETIRARAQAVLDALPPDPDAAGHRVALCRALDDGDA